MKAAIYARVSTDEQDAGKQVSLCQEYCSRNAIEIYRVYRDDAVSGKIASRPAFNELLADMRRMRFNMIVVSRLDRIGRSLQHILSLFNEFKVLGVHFAAVTQAIDTSSSAGIFQMQVWGALAEFEGNLISERTKEGLRGVENVGKRGRDKKPRKKRGVLRKPLFERREKV